ncbi:MAG TPA: FecR domain-containing protein, partial [Puia sp.]|nr:FecR domain-containing protein [Puia sp.]
MSKQEARLFIARYVSGSYSSGERGNFLKWLEEASVRDLDDIVDQFEALEEEWPLADGPSSLWMVELEGKLDESGRKRKVAPLIIMRPKRSTKRALGVAAAVMVVALSGGIYKWYSRPGGTGPGISQKSSEVLTNIVSVKRGERERQCILADGSKVWLNSGSKLTYPKSFVSGERTVELSGEAYFEVAKDASMPFHVKVREMKIEVLGTSFNVAAYNEDRVSKTSLLEGSVKITRGTETRILGPGDQAQITYPLSGSSMKVVNGIDRERILAWKNGLLQFKNDDLQTVMNEISRSYDVEVVYSDKNHVPATRYTGQI